jgi:hypothetical protein
MATSYEDYLKKKKKHEPYLTKAFILNIFNLPALPQSIICCTDRRAFGHVAFLFMFILSAKALVVP